MPGELPVPIQPPLPHAWLTSWCAGAAGPLPALAAALLALPAITWGLMTFPAHLGWAEGQGVVLGSSRLGRVEMPKAGAAGRS